MPFYRVWQKIILTRYNNIPEEINRYNVPKLLKLIRKDEPVKEEKLELINSNNFSLHKPNNPPSSRKSHTSHL